MPAEQGEDDESISRGWRLSREVWLVMRDSKDDLNFGAAMSAAQPAHGVAADLAAWVHDAGRAVGESTRGGRVPHEPDGEVETVVDDQAVRLG